MLGPAIKKFGAENNLSVMNGAMVGNYKGYFINLNEGMGYKLIRIAAYLKDKGDLIAIIDNDIKIIGKNYIMSTKYDISYIEVILQDILGMKAKYFSILDKIIETLSINNILGETNCTICGEKLDTKESFVTSLPFMIMPIHKECMVNVTDVIIKEDVEINQNKSYAKGLIGALLGAIIFSIPLIIVYLIGYITAYLAVVIGIGANLGYKLFGGKIGKSQITIIIIGMIIGLVISVFTSYCLEIYMFSEIVGLTIMDTPFVFFEAMATVPEYSSAIGTNSLQIAFFSAIGVIVYLSYMNKAKLRKGR